MPTYCIMCGKEKSGIPVRNDRVIGMIRFFKRNVTKDEQRNNLVVCKEDYPKYRKNRDKYTFRQVVYIGFGVIFLVLGMLISFRISTLIFGLVIVFFLYLLSLMNYTPALVVDEKDLTSKKAKHNQ